MAEHRDSDWGLCFATSAVYIVEVHAGDGDLQAIYIFIRISARLDCTSSPQSSRGGVAVVEPAMGDRMARCLRADGIHRDLDRDGFGIVCDRILAISASRFTSTELKVSRQGAKFAKGLDFVGYVERS